MKTAVVVGASGLTGKFLIKRLVQDGSFSQIIAICRSKTSCSELLFSNPKLRLLQFDFENWDDLELQVGAFVGTSTSSFFCCLGTTIRQAGSEAAFRKVDYEYVVKFARLAKHCRAEQLIMISALGADKNSAVFYNRTKGEMEEDVQFDFSGKLYFLRPSLLLGDRRDFRLGERIAILLAPLYSSLLLGSLKKYRPVRADKVAQVMTQLATKKLSARMFLENEDILTAE